MVFHGPNRSGRSRHGKPVFAMKTTAFKKCRFDNSAGRPGRSRSGGSRCLIRTQSTAVSSCRRITTVDHETIFPSIPQRQAITVLRDFPANPTSGCPSLRTRPRYIRSEVRSGLEIREHPGKGVGDEIEKVAQRRLEGSRFPPTSGIGHIESPALLGEEAEASAWPGVVAGTGNECQRISASLGVEVAELAALEKFFGDREIEVGGGELGHGQLRQRAGAQPA